MAMGRARVGRGCGGFWFLTGPRSTTLRELRRRTTACHGTPSTARCGDCARPERVRYDASSCPGISPLDTHRRGRHVALSTCFQGGHTHSTVPRAAYRLGMCVGISVESGNHPRLSVAAGRLEGGNCIQRARRHLGGPHHCGCDGASGHGWLGSHLVPDVLSVAAPCWNKGSPDHQGARDPRCCTGSTLWALRCA